MFSGLARFSINSTEPAIIPRAVCSPSSYPRLNSSDKGKEIHNCVAVDAPTAQVSSLIWSSRQRCSICFRPGMALSIFIAAGITIEYPLCTDLENRGMGRRPGILSPPIPPCRAEGQPHNREIVYVPGTKVTVKVGVGGGGGGAATLRDAVPTALLLLSVTLTLTLPTLLLPFATMRVGVVLSGLPGVTFATLLGSETVIAKGPDDETGLPFASVSAIATNAPFVVSVVRIDVMFIVFTPSPKKNTKRFR